eukprot:TRINITY_DN6481_c0_g1_i1.p1 TRINITY_DN6481_c0_g1~~TRINITY_DN6481_c0_g1_i1.p1  ORF type:complete len:273 (-),score=59.82 TRINITY_DN6481_c0_g1_i1:17-835(-)
MFLTNLLSDKDTIVTPKDENALSPQTLARISSHSSLRKLIISSTPITQIPSTLFGPNLSLSLRELNISNNRLDSIPPEIGLMLQLEKLNISKNFLVDIPPEIGDLIRLRRLDISKNCIVSLPRQLTNCTRLREIYAMDNPPLVDPPEYIVLEGAKSILTYLAKNHDRNSTENPFDIDKENSKDVAKSKQKQLEYLLKEIEGRDAFKRFLIPEHSEENLQFYDHVVKFNYIVSITNSHEIIEKEAWRIFNCYFTVDHGPFTEFFLCDIVLSCR